MVLTESLDRKASQSRLTSKLADYNTIQSRDPPNFIASSFINPHEKVSHFG